MNQKGCRVFNILKLFLPMTFSFLFSKSLWLEKDEPENEKEMDTQMLICVIKQMVSLVGSG